MVDHDTVDTSNLQRQVIHSAKNVGMNKALSAAAFVGNINEFVKCNPIQHLLDSSNALDILSHYQVVVDATDNVATRYLLNDACVLSRIPLVSGGALGMDGQITVYNPEGGGPCYRCIFPTPPPPETVGNCSDNGIVGAITGVIGSLQALEVLKIVTGKQASLQGKLIVFSGTQSSFRTVKLRPKRPDCSVCGENPSITQLIDYVQFCGAGPHDKALDLKVLKRENRISVKEYKEIVDNGLPHVMLDVREKIQFEICSFEDAISKRLINFVFIYLLITKLVKIYR